ncbi:MAG: hypothetical protein JEY91_05130 [Spirochaetaceae bacterium]|nr:hypothetical protein [Spirochaetaceae bacterium]
MYKPSREEIIENFKDQYELRIINREISSNETIGKPNLFKLIKKMRAIKKKIDEFDRKLLIDN